MSKPVAVEWAESAEELEERYRREREVERRKRLGALWRVRVGDRVADAGRLVGVGVRTVDRWLGWYRVGGLGDVLRRVPGHGAAGNPHRLSARAAGRVGGAVCGRGVPDVRGSPGTWVETTYGVKYRPGGFYTSVRRLGVRPKVPRPVAEKADRVAQEAWKQGG